MSTVYRISIANVTPERLASFAALYWKDGGTVLPHVGYWRDPESGEVVRESGATLEVAGEPEHAGTSPWGPVRAILRAVGERSAYVTADGRLPTLVYARGAAVPL